MQIISVFLEDKSLLWVSSAVLVLIFIGVLIIQKNKKPESQK